MHLVIEESSPLKIDPILARKTLNDLRRVEKPVFIVLPELDVIRKILVYATAD
jgi:hypothetical protein